MPLLLDIGNTAVTYGIAPGNRFSQTGSCLIGDIPKIVHKYASSGSKSSFNIVISSVVPKSTRFILDSIPQFKGKIWIAGQNLPIPMKNRYRFPKKLGIDRLVNAYGALQKYRPPLLIIDYGTAISFDYVSPSGVFEGGMLFPGPELSLQALIQRAALLPKKIRLPKKAASFLGKTTYDCLSSGVLEGYGALTDGLVQRFKARFGKLKVIGTGGFLIHLKPTLHSIDVFDPLHSLKSLLLAYQKL